MVNPKFPKLLLLILGLCWCLLVGCAVNPISGEEELMLFAPEEDIQLGRQYSPEVEKELGGRIADEALQSYIDGVGQRIARVCHRPDWDYRFVAVEHESVNAVAVPGGYIFITRGMLEKLSTEAQLAGILGHEIAHVVARDSAAALSREYGMGILLAAIQAAGASGDAVKAAAFTKQILSLRYSRKDEQEADLAGMDYMVRAAYVPSGMVETMQILRDLQQVRPIEFFSTHPLPQNRMMYLSQRIASRYSNVGGLNVGREDYRQGVLARLQQETPVEF
ncbi:MAG: M48 family metalloprotease [Phycisphaerales bacterium]|nr:MAG: M48 family metalloprotease [Phycisphaerales bacterium]